MSGTEKEEKGRTQRITFKISWRYCGKQKKSTHSFVCCTGFRLDLQSLPPGPPSQLTTERWSYLQWPNSVWVPKPKAALLGYPNPIKVSRNPLSKVTFSLAFQPLLQQADCTCLLLIWTPPGLSCVLESPAWEAQVLIFFSSVGACCCRSPVL